jgi:hypothetical protein
LLPKTAAALQMLAGIVHLIVKVNQANRNACDDRSALIGFIEPTTTRN